MTYIILNKNKKSTILLAKNGHMYQLHNRMHFLVKDNYGHGKLEIKQDSTDMMWSNFVTKPKQERLSYVIMAEPMNCPIKYNEKSS